MRNPVVCGRPTRTPWTEAQDATIRAMREAGASWREIGNAVGAPRNRTRDRGRTLGVADTAADHARQDRNRLLGERGLCVAVVERRIADALTPPRNGKPDADNPSVVDHTRARYFCLSRDAEWVAEREWWCDGAGIHPEAVRAYVARRVGEGQGESRRTGNAPAELGLG